MTRLIGVGLAAAVLMAFTACGDGEKPLVRVRQAGLLPFFNTVWPTIVAQEQGFFAEEGLDVQFNWTFDSLPLLVGGQADLILESADTGLLAVARGAEVIAVAPLSTRVTIGFMGGPGITSAADLEGKKLGVTGVPSTDQYMWIRWLEKHGLSQDDVEFVSVEDPLALLANLEAGTIDASNLEIGVFFKAQEAGEFNVLATPADIGVFPWTIVQTTKQWAQENDDLLVGYVRAVRRATQFILDPGNKEAVIDAVLKQAEGAERADIEGEYDAALANPEIFTLEPLTAEDVQPAADMVVFFEFIEEEAINIEAFLDMSYYQRALE